MRQQHFVAAAWAGLILMAAASAAWLLTAPPSPLAAAERLAQAIAFRHFGPQRAPNPPVVVIGVTEETLAAFPYRSPIDRGFLADLIGLLAERGVAAIGLDVMFDRATEPPKDEALHQVLAHSAVPVVTISVAPDTDLAPRQRQFLAAFLAGVRTGDANLARDRFDDVVREHVPFHTSTGAPSLPAALAGALGAAVPKRPFPIEWQRPGLPIYPAQAVGSLPAAWLKGKVALIGSLSPGSDEHRTLASAFGAPSFGVEIHAQVVADLLAGIARPAPAVPWAELLSIGGLACLGLMIGLTWGGWLAAGALIVLGLLFTAGAIALYGSTGDWLPLVPSLLALACSGGAARAWRGWADRRDRRALRTLFSRFVSEPVVAEIMRERDLFMAGGRPRPQELTATVLYADVASFTTICEAMAPEPLIGWLDGYIDAMAGIIMDHHGVLLRFIGDGILAVFGVPVPRRDEAAITADARNAARCALAMEQAMARLNDGWRAAGLPEGGLRVGLHTGRLVAGSLGTGARMEFCLLGDTANVGARLEQLGKDFAERSPRYCTIVVGGPTWDRLGPEFPGQKLGEFPLRGRRTPMAAYRIDSAAAAMPAGKPAHDHRSVSETSSSAS